MQTALLLLPDFALIALGAWLRRAFHLGDHFWAGLEKLVYFILFPALLFNAITRNPITLSSAGPIAAAGLLIMATGVILGLLARGFALPPLQFASLFQCAYRFNSYIALAVAGKLNGAAGIAVMGLILGVTVPVANISAVWMLARHGQTGILRELSRNPLIIATLAGLLWSSLGFGVAEPIRAFMGRLSDASIALGLMSVGAALRLKGDLDAPARPAAGYLMAVKLLVLPLAALGGASLLHLSGIEADTALIFGTLPVASSAYILAQRMGGDGGAVAWVISVTTVLAMVTIPFWLTVAR
ncbi:MAG: AEC family transporter [Rhodocyclaceae bacterium]|nr:MAG: AEC family transporter [Rhodocyclaceae bacterium]